MFTTLVAVLCLGPVCVERIVSDSAMDSSLTWISCQIQGQQEISSWLQDNPEYAQWHLAKWKCVPGHYVIPGQA